jgi:predicted nucleic acid-binding protein
VGAFSLLRSVWHDLIIPEGVIREVVHAGVGRPGAAEVIGATWIRVETVSDGEAVTALPAALGLGEREAIVLAKERGLTLLVDDPAARNEARRQGVIISGSLGTLLAAKSAGVIPAAKPVLDRMVVAGWRVSRQVYERTLRRAGEEP